MPESVQSCFELSIHLSVQRTSRDLLLKIARGRKIQVNVWKVQNTTGRFLAQLHPSIFFFRRLYPSFRRVLIKRSGYCKAKLDADVRFYLSQKLPKTFGIVYC